MMTTNEQTPVFNSLAELRTKTAGSGVSVSSEEEDNAVSLPTVHPQKEKRMHPADENATLLQQRRILKIYHSQTRREPHLIGLFLKAKLSPCHRLASTSLKHSFHDLNAMLS